MGSVFITGGSRGIGAACVRAFAEAGRPAAFTYSARRDKAEALSAETGALALCADSADRDAVEKAVKTARESLGAIDNRRLATRGSRSRSCFRTSRMTSG